MAQKKSAAKSQNTETGSMVAMGAGLAALAAGAYFFFGPDGKKHQKKMKGWMVSMKGQVLEKMEDAQDLTQPIYNQIIDTVAKAQAVAGKIPKDEVLALAADLKKQWRTISRSASGIKKVVSSKKAPVSKVSVKKTKKPAKRSTK